MFLASAQYPIANTTYILADTSHPGFKTKFDPPRLGVRAVHVYIYGADGNVEPLHHTGITQPGTYEKLWFNRPPDLTPNASQAEQTAHKIATASHARVSAWHGKNDTETHHAVIATEGEYVADYDLAARSAKKEAKKIFNTKAVASPFIAMVAETAMRFANGALAETKDRRSEVMRQAEPLEAVVQVDVKGFNSGQKKTPANVHIKGTIRARLKEIFKRVPHVSATNAHKEIVTSYEFNMWVLYNVSEERCKRLFSSWTTRAKKPKAKLVGWKQWRVSRLAVFVRHFNPTATVRNKNMNELIKLLPPFEEKYNVEMLTVGNTKAAEATTCESDSDDEADGNDVVVGEPPEKAVDHMELEAADCGEEGSNLDQVISLMAPPKLVPSPKKRKPKAPKRKRDKAPAKKPKRKKGAQPKEEAKWDVDFIVEGPNSKGEFLIRWEDYESDADTWEPPDHLCPVLVQQFVDGSESDSDSTGDELPIASQVSQKKATAN